MPRLKSTSVLGRSFHAVMTLRSGVNTISLVCKYGSVFVSFFHCRQYNVFALYCLQLETTQPSLSVAVNIEPNLVDGYGEECNCSSWRTFTSGKLKHHNTLVTVIHDCLKSGCHLRSILLIHERFITLLADNYAQIKFCR